MQSIFKDMEKAKILLLSHTTQNRWRGKETSPPGVPLPRSSLLGRVHTLSGKFSQAEGLGTGSLDPGSSSNSWWSSPPFCWTLSQESLISDTANLKIHWQNPLLQPLWTDDLQGSFPACNHGTAWKLCTSVSASVTRVRIPWTSHTLSLSVCVSSPSSISISSSLPAWLIIIIIIIGSLFFAQLENFYGAVWPANHVALGTVVFSSEKWGDQGCLVSRRLSGSDTMWVLWPSCPGWPLWSQGNSSAQGRHLLLSAQGGNSRFWGRGQPREDAPFSRAPESIPLGLTSFFLWSVVKSHHIINAHIQLWVPLKAPFQLQVWAIWR